MSKQRFILIAWPADHDEDLAEHACDLQECIDTLQMGGARVIGPLPDIVNENIESAASHNSLRDWLP